MHDNGDMQFEYRRTHGYVPRVGDKVVLVLHPNRMFKVEGVIIVECHRNPEVTKRPMRFEVYLSEVKA